jgi:organic radical activating enzyme
MKDIPTFNSSNKQTLEKLNQISPSLCLAKWTQTTLHLGLGHTHSCHHPRTHKISVDEITKNPSALHNTEYKKQRRKEMLEGIRPSECEYCWKVEDLTESNHYSDRILKSSQVWSMPYLDEILIKGSEENINPKYLEVSFSNVCNFKCAYCMPSISSQWMEEIERYGPYPTSDSYNNLDWPKLQGKMPIPNKEHNPYVEAFWKWFPELIDELHTFRITGGEPLLDKNTFKILDFLLENPKPNLEFSINSNFDVPDDLLNKFIEKISLIEKNNCVKMFTLHTSCEAHGAAAEYIRYGLNYNKWIANLEKYILKVDRPLIGIMSTYNVLSVDSYILFLQDILKIKKIIADKSYTRLGECKLDIPYLNHPLHLSVKILPEDFKSLIEDQLLFCKINSNENIGIFGFTEFEIHKLSRVYNLFSETVNDTSFDYKKYRIDFIKFIEEYDRRRQTNFLKTFPTLEPFYQSCRQL